MTTPAPLALRQYQIAGRDFLLDRRFALLGDAMGLGKTPQSLAAIGSLLAADPTARVLLVAPAATLPGLAREVRRWLPGVEPVTLDHAGKVAAPASGLILLAWTSAAKRLDSLLAGPRFAVCVLDEAHRAKNPGAAVTKAALGKWEKVAGTWVRRPSLVGHSARVWALTGTPIPNRPIELQPLLQLAGELRWAGRTVFGDRYCRQANRWAPRGFDYLGANNLGELGARLRSEGILLRRLPEDVPGELPSLTTSIVPLAGIRDAEAVAAAGLDPEAIRKACDGGDTMPFEELAAYRAELGVLKAKPVAAWVAGWLEDNEDGALVLFVWHREVARIVAEELGNDEAGNPIAFVATGDDTPEARQAMVDAFAAGQRRVFVGSIAACGTGLNGLHLRTTSCAFGESPWTPGELTQAIGRVRRFGSSAEHAFASILVGTDSLEDYILQTIAAKLDTTAAILGDTVAKGSAAAVAVAPVAAIAAPVAVAAPTEADPVPEPTERAWTWARLRSGGWGIRADHAGSPAWEGAEVLVRNREGVAKPARVGARVAGAVGWSVYELGKEAPEVADREYVRRRMGFRNEVAAADRSPLTADEAVAAVALSAVCGQLTGNDPDFAAVRNEVGWSSADGKIGRVFAGVPAALWDRGTLAGARALLRTYANTQAAHAAWAIRGEARKETA